MPEKVCNSCRWFVEEEAKKMTLQELTTRLQTLCYDGYAQKEVLIDISGYGVHLAPVEDIKLCFKSSVMEDGFISVTMGSWKNFEAL